MLIRFRVKNHRSIRDEQVLSMVATEPLDDPNLLSSPAIEEKLVPSAAIYGANASGKSNLISALQFMSDCVLESHRYWEPDASIPVDPFAFGELSPSSYEIDFIVQGASYTYGFSLSKDQVEEEHLIRWRGGEGQDIFTRERDRFELDDRLGPSPGLTEITRRNSLLLSAGAQNNQPLLLSIFGWFRKFPRSTVGYLTVVAGMLQSRFDETKEVLLDFLRLADVGIVDLKLQGTGRERLLLLKHTSRGATDGWLPIEQESSGTRRMIEIALPFAVALAGGYHLVLDEIESSLHPSISLALLTQFQKEARATGAQLIFTTHDTQLLAPTVGESPLRRDQIWFTEKNAEGATELYSLSDFELSEGKGNLERGYLQGRYGAVPFLGDFSKLAKLKAS